MLKQTLIKLKKKFLRWLLKDVDELHVGKNSVVIKPDSIVFELLNRDPVYEEGKVWYRSDQKRFYIRTSSETRYFLTLDDACGSHNSLVHSSHHTTVQSADNSSNYASYNTSVNTSN